MKKYSSATIWIIGLLLFFAVATFMLDGSSVSNRMVYSDFQQKWINNQVESINVNADKMTIEVTTQDEKKYTVYAPSSMIEFLNEQYPKDDIKIEYVAPSNSSIWVSLLPTIMIIILFVVFIFFFTQQSQGGGSSGRGVMNFGKSKAKMVIPDSKRVTFDDVAGADEEKEELEEIVDFLKQPERYVEMGARIPKGVLLVGPPGTGKTLLAKAIAGEAGVPFFSISGSDFVEMFVGVGASRVRDLFEQAKKNSPSLIFIDDDGNTVQQQKLKLEKEAREIHESIQKSLKRDFISFETRWATRVTDLLQFINEVNPTILHFSGHGTSDGKLVFQDNNDKPKLLSMDALVELINASSDNLRLVV